MNNHWDAIVVGTGPAGATVAKELVSFNKKVLILEKGYPDLSINIPKMLYHREMMFIGKGKTLVRGIRPGGTSVLYYGTSYDPPYEMFKSYGIDLTQEVVELKRELPIAPLSDQLIGAVARTVMTSALELGLPWRKLDKFVYQDLCKAEGFSSKAQWDSFRLLEIALEQGAIIELGADVQEIIVENGKAVGVWYLCKGQKRCVYADKIVLAAGGNGSPTILQASGIANAGSGFFCDPVVIVHGTMPGLAAGKEIPMTTGCLFPEEGFLLTDLTVPKIVYQLFAAQAFRFDRLFSYHHTASVMVKVKDELGGRILSDGKAAKVFTELDQEKMRRGTSIARKILNKCGAQKIYQTAWTSAHPGGSVRVGELVNSDLETEYKNLYVCDCSVIPTSWGLPPTLTIMALAKRLAKKLAGRF